MLDITKILIDGAWLSLIFVVLILAAVLYNPRLMLNAGDIPPDILAAVPPKTEREKRQSLWLGIPLIAVMFLLPGFSAYTFAQQAPDAGFWTLFAHTFWVTLIPNLVDLVLLDWLVFCTITPGIFVYPGTEGMAGYKDYGFHLRQHVRALPFVLLAVAALAGVVWLIS